VSGNGVSWDICKSAPSSRQTTMPALHQSVFTGRMPFLLSDKQRQMKAKKPFLKLPAWLSANHLPILCYTISNGPYCLCKAFFLMGVSGWMFLLLLAHLGSPRKGLLNSCMCVLDDKQHFKTCTGWAKKTGLFFRLDNFVTVSPRKACSMSKFLEILLRKKVQNSHFNEFKHSLPNLLKLSQQLKLCYIWPEHVDCTQFTLTYSETTVILHVF